MIGAIIGNLKKSSASLIIENLLELEKTILSVQFNAEDLSIDLVNRLWVEEESVFKGRYFNWPDKLSICVASLAYGINSANYNGDRKQAMIASLFTALVEVEDNHMRLFERPIDKHLILFALRVGEEIGDEAGELDLWNDIALIFDKLNLN